MTTTLASAGGNSIVNDGTGPSLVIKGFVEETGNDVAILVDANIITYKLKDFPKLNVFRDDFNYHTTGTTLLLSNAECPFKKSNVWYLGYTSGKGLDMAQVTNVASTNRLGTLKVENNVSTTAGEYILYAPGVRFGVEESSVINIRWAVKIDSISSSPESIIYVGLVGVGSGSMEGFKLKGGETYLRVSAFGTDATTTTTMASIYGSWIVLGIDFVPSSSFANFSVNGTSVATRSSIGSYMPGDYAPAIKAYRAGTTSALTYYVDYVDVNKVLTSDRPA